jgi:broad specificity phosphatase PhoE
MTDRVSSSHRDHDADGAMRDIAVECAVPPIQQSSAAGRAPSWPMCRSYVGPMFSTVVLLQHGTKARTGVDPSLTDQGREQAERAAALLAEARPTSLVSSPLVRAQESIQPLSDATGLPIVIDDRVRERMEFSPDVWNSVPDFLHDWEHATEDRDFAPASGDSSCQAAARLRSAIVDHAHSAQFVVISTHGGVTVDLLRTVAGEGVVEERLLREGMPNGHLTTLLVAGDEIGIVGIGVEPQAWAAPVSR